MPAAPSERDLGEGSDGPTRWLPDAAILLVLTGGFLVALVLLREPPLVYDPVEYFHTATRLPSVSVNHRGLRLGLLLPIRAGQILFGYSQAAYYLVPFLSGAGLIVGTYGLARMFFGRAVATAAGAVVVFNPYIFGGIHQIYPDLPSTALFTAGIALVVLGARRATDGAERSAALTHAILLGGGLLLGWSYLVREFIVLLFPLVLVVFVAYRLPLRYVASVVLAALAVLAFELGWYAVVFDDPLIRIRTVLGQAEGGRPSEHLEDLIEARIDRRGSRLERLVKIVAILGAPRVGLLFVGLAACLVAGALLVRDRRYLILSSWAVGYWAVVTALSIIERNEAGQTFLFPNHTRYWLPLIPPLIIGGIGAVRSGVVRIAPRGRALATVSVFVVGLVAATGTVVPMSASTDGPREYEQFRDWLQAEGEGEEVIWTTQRSAWILRMFTRSPFGNPIWDGRIRTVNTAFRFVEVQELDRGLLVLQDSFFKPRFSNWREVTPDYLIDPPDRWAPVFVTDRSAIVVYNLGDAGPDEVEATVLDGPWDIRTVGPTPDAAVDDVVPGTPELDLDLTAGQRLIVSRENLRIEGLGRGDGLRLHVAVGAEGAGNIVPFCFFGDREGRRIRVEASGAWGLPSEYRRVEFVCGVPPQLGERFSVTVGMNVNGPVEARLGETTVVVAPNSHRAFPRVAGLE